MTVTFCSRATEIDSNILMLLSSFCGLELWVHGKGLLLPVLLHSRALLILESSDGSALTKSNL